MFNPRLKIIKEISLKKNAIVYWMSRDQRVEYNHALLFAQKLALNRKLPLIVVFILQKKFLSATWRQYHFMLQGLKEVVNKLKEYHVDFYLIDSLSVKESFQKLISKLGSFDLVTDFSPLKIKKRWLEEIIDLPVSIYEIDAHNIVPYHQVSDKKEYAAFSLRKKITPLVPKFLKEPEKPIIHPYRINFNIDNNLNHLLEKNINQFKNHLKIDFSVKPVYWLKPGKSGALVALNRFIKETLPNYYQKRNEIYPSYQSQLSPYLHFGQISSLEVALKVKNSQVKEENKIAFLEELIVRRELADNFCYYEENYDNYLGLPSWGKATLFKHQNDKREYLYNIEQLEFAKTHDQLWNAAQLEMVKKGKMHGYLRMYWAKKILEWSPNPQEAIKKAIYLNDKYELDGRDPNGYVGILWSIGGLHDRPFFERPIYGLIRYMSKKSIEKKYNVKGYINYVNNL